MIEVSYPAELDVPVGLVADDLGDPLLDDLLVLKSGHHLFEYSIMKFRTCTFGPFSDLRPAITSLRLQVERGKELGREP